MNAFDSPGFCNLCWFEYRESKRTNNAVTTSFLKRKYYYFHVLLFYFFCIFSNPLKTVIKMMISGESCVKCLVTWSLVTRVHGPIMQDLTGNKGKWLQIGRSQSSGASFINFTILRYCKPYLWKSLDQWMDIVQGNRVFRATVLSCKYIFASKQLKFYTFWNFTYEVRWKNFYVDRSIHQNFQ